jgi:hypothetical protein
MLCCGGMFPTCALPRCILCANARLRLGTDVLYWCYSKYSLIVIGLLLFSPALVLAIGVYCALIGVLSSFYICLASLAFILAVYVVVLPLRINIYADRVSVVSLLGIRYTTYFADIINVSLSRGLMMHPCNTLKFATDIESFLIIQRKSACFEYIIMSPTDCATFQSRLRAAMRPAQVDSPYMVAPAMASAPSPYVGASPYIYDATKGQAYV